MNGPPPTAPDARREMATLCLVAALLGFVALPAMHLAEHAMAPHGHRHAIDGSTRRVVFIAHVHGGHAHRHRLVFDTGAASTRDGAHAARTRPGDTPAPPPFDHGDGGLAHLRAALLVTPPSALPAPTTVHPAPPAPARDSRTSQRTPARDGAPRGPPPRRA